MAEKSRDVKSTNVYFPAVVYTQLARRAKGNFNSVSREVVQIVGRFLQQEEAKQQEQSREAATV